MSSNRAFDEKEWEGTHLTCIPPLAPLFWVSNVFGNQYLVSNVLCCVAFCCVVLCCVVLCCVVL